MFSIICYMSSEIKTNKELTKYSKELAEDIKLNEYNLKEKSLMCSSLWAKWLSYLYMEKENIDKLTQLKQKIIKSKMSDNKNSDSVLRLKSEEKIAENDEKIKKINLLIKQTNDSIDFIERALNILSNFGFNIKNCIEIFKLQLK